MQYTVLPVCFQLLFYFCWRRPISTLQSWQSWSSSHQQQANDQQNGGVQTSNESVETRRATEKNLTQVGFLWLSNPISSCLTPRSRFCIFLYSNVTSNMEMYSLFFSKVLLCNSVLIIFCGERRKRWYQTNNEETGWHGHRLHGNVRSNNNFYKLATEWWRVFCSSDWSKMILVSSMS